MAHRIEVFYKISDTRAEVRKKKLAVLGLDAKTGDFSTVSIEAVYWSDLYTIDLELSQTELKKIAQALANPLIHLYKIDQSWNQAEFDYAIEVGFLPGVTDNVGQTTKETIEDLLKIKFPQGRAVYFSQLTFLKGKLSQNQARLIADSWYNPLIHRVQIKSQESYINEHGMDRIVPKVKLEPGINSLVVNLNISDEELAKLGKQGIVTPQGLRRGPLALTKEYLKIIRDYFEKQEGRNPYDIELESIAQTWSEHCKHTIFASPIDDIPEGIYRRYIKGATEKIRAANGENDICVSVFKDNSGAIIFDENYLITHKVETHNTPSALDPFGGAITGIVGVNRDCIGFGKGAKPVANCYGFCFANPDDEAPLYRDKERKKPMLKPLRIIEGVVAGVRAGGNESGIPTPNGFIYFHQRYKGKPLVFCGTVGLIPRKINNENSFEKAARPGDLIVVVGGRTGLDGIHGATFSSEVLDSGSPATAVQIGDPITQKKFSDALIKEARYQGLYRSITDNGAGGLSCAVSEMAKEADGFRVDLNKVPVKYPNLEPWQIWISESQERMTLAVSPQDWPKLRELMGRRGVEATVIGEFTDSGRCEVLYDGQKIMDMDLKFLHEGLTYFPLKTEEYKEEVPESDVSMPKSLNDTLLEMMSRPNLASFSFISYQFDHEVQGGSVLKPLQGKGKVNALSAVMRPVLHSKRGVLLSSALYPTYTEIDAYKMAAACVDTAIRNIIAAGGSLNHLALLDNFCWCSADDPKRLRQLKEAAAACYEYAVYFGTPFISGKDSMFNDFKGFDENGDAISISVPPTLLISAIGVITDVSRGISLDTKIAGDLIYLIGKTDAKELGGSEYLPYCGNKVPEVDKVLAKKLYLALEKVVSARLVASAQSVTHGGLAVALVKKALGGQLGLDIDISDLDNSASERTDYLLFSESQSRIVVTVAPNNEKEFRTHFQDLPVFKIGEVISSKNFRIKNQNKVWVDLGLDVLDRAYREIFKNF